MTDDLPVWPAKLTREQQRAVKQRKRVFELALKQAGRTRGWRYAGGELFRQDGEWIATVSPWLLWERGALMQFRLKPMALDLLFWEIVGLPENSRLPLSFRVTGAWVLRPPSQELQIGRAESEPDRLAEMVVDASDAELVQSRGDRSVESILAELREIQSLSGQTQAVAICLQILAGNLDEALALCGTDPAGSGGGFLSGNLTFLDQAKDWIVAKRRDAIAQV